ncbi:uncharacterized protein RCC_06382 [Ramularia collo-cygni]|uniref:Exosome complex protein n=1 Tax=Ramularia collo-cygni TaxID=112498 RepID=A0A2D3USY4_9PEZI|nr:uncharacterized protein RCC_06382 [Ramularia collo-cygni]CZT20522.1 uncharacterized protein RCC_06382 [Ramularia collo-cygni]
MDESIQPQIVDLQESLANLEASLSPILTAGPLSTATSTLPLLDKAKLYVLATYALESILFSYLRLNGVDAKEHDVFKELARVKEYFSKISGAEGRGKGAAQPRLDKGAASRFVKAGLAGNGKLEDMEGKGKHTRFEAAGKRFREAEDTVPVVRAEDVDDEEEDEGEVVEGKEAEGEEKKRKRKTPEEREKAARKKARKEARTAREGKRWQHLMEEK